MSSDNNTVDKGIDTDTDITEEERFTAGVDYPEPFDQYALKLACSASRYLWILSPDLDHAAFDNQALTDALSKLARDSRQTEVRILVNDSRALVSRGHRLLALARRMPSAIQIQRIEDHPQWNGETIVLRDRDGVLYRPGGADQRAFYEPASRASAQRHIELFESLWRYSHKDPNLRALTL